MVWGLVFSSKDLQDPRASGPCCYSLTLHGSERERRESGATVRIRSWKELPPSPRRNAIQSAQRPKAPPRVRVPTGSTIPPPNGIAGHDESARAPSAGLVEPCRNGSEDLSPLEEAHLSNFDRN